MKGEGPESISRLNRSSDDTCSNSKAQSVMLKARTCLCFTDV